MKFEKGPLVVESVEAAGDRLIYPYIQRRDVTAVRGAQIRSYGQLPFSTLQSRVSETTAWLFWMDIQG